VVRIKVHKVNAFLFLAFLMLSACRGSEQGQVTFINDTNSNIDVLDVDVCSQHFSFKNVPARKSRMINYKVTCESAYNVSVIFNGGKSVSQNIGYVTPGLGIDDVVLIRADNMAIQAEK
jgi:hypothetical protein